MLRRGKEQGWLSLPISSLQSWASFNRVTIRDISIGPLPGFESRGSAIKTNTFSLSHEQNPVMVVPSELILSKEAVEQYAKSDKHMHELLDAVGDFGRVRCLHNF